MNKPGYSEFMIVRPFGPEERALIVFAKKVGLSAEAAAGDLADYFCYGVVTGHRPGILTEWQLSDFPCRNPTHFGD